MVLNASLARRDYVFQIDDIRKAMLIQPRRTILCRITPNSQSLLFLFSQLPFFFSCPLFIQSLLLTHFPLSLPKNLLLRLTPTRITLHRSPSGMRITAVHYHIWIRIRTGQDGYADWDGTVSFVHGKSGCFGEDVSLDGVGGWWRLNMVWRSLVIIMVLRLWLELGLGLGSGLGLGWKGRYSVPWLWRGWCWTQRRGYRPWWWRRRPRARAFWWAIVVFRYHGKGGLDEPRTFGEVQCVVILYVSSISIFRIRVCTHVGTRVGWFVWLGYENTVMNGRVVWATAVGGGRGGRRGCYWLDIVLIIMVGFVR